jgi:hypothetical protein
MVLLSSMLVTNQAICQIAHRAAGRDGFDCLARVAGEKTTMALSLVNIDEQTRQFMLNEVEHDLANDKLYISPRLNPQGRIAYPELLKRAIATESDDWLGKQLRFLNLMNPMEQRRKPKGGFVAVKVPVTAPDTLAEGEYNRFYARGLCVRAIAEGVTTLEIYRAKAVMQPRSDSQANIGTRIDARALLDDLRGSVGIDTALGLPPGPNSGLSVKVPWIS